MRRVITNIGYIFLLLLSMSVPCAAQGIPNYQVLGSCGSASYTAGTQRPPTVDTSGNTCGNTSGAGGAVVPKAGTSSTIATGGTAVVFVTGPVHGGYITNPPNAASQDIGTAENAYCDPVNTPGSTDAVGNNTTSILQPGQTYTVPAIASGVTISCNAATSGHDFTVVVW